MSVVCLIPGRKEMNFYALSWQTHRPKKEPIRYVKPSVRSKNGYEFFTLLPVGFSLKSKNIDNLNVTLSIWKGLVFQIAWECPCNFSCNDWAWNVHQYFTPYNIAFGDAHGYYHRLPVLGILLFATSNLIFIFVIDFNQLLSSNQKDLTKWLQNCIENLKKLL